MSLLIRNGTIVTADDTFVGDVLCEGEAIAAVGFDLQAPEGAGGGCDGEVCVSRVH
jgi:dihydropyrimidinase